MSHPLVDQLRFTRSEFRRALRGVSDEDGARRLLPMNCIAWNVGHLAWQEQRYFLWRAQDRMLLPDINAAFAYGAPGSTPALSAMWKAWRTITGAADPWLDALTTEILQQEATQEGKPLGTSYGNLLQRVIYHYWYHTGENLAIRQTLGHEHLPEFVGNIDAKAPYRAESGASATLEA